MTEQEKRDRVIEGLKRILHSGKMYEAHLVIDTCEAAIALLKTQEPVEPTTKNGAYFCGNPHCRKIIAQMVPCGAPTHRVKYCSECGKAVKWE